MLRSAAPWTRLPLALISWVLLGEGCSRREEPPPIPAPLRAELEGWLHDHGKDPVPYVVDLFQDHDVVFLGERHYIRDDALLVQSLLPRLHAAGVRVLATEFARREDQHLVDSLLAMPAWDEPLARRIQFQQYVSWGFREYVDILRAAWELNRGLPAGLPPFQVLGMNDSPDWSIIRTSQDQDRDDLKRAVWRGGGEDHWAAVIIGAVAAGDKVLAHCGIHHAFTEFRQPVVAGGSFVRFDSSRVGNHVERALGDRVMTVFLHAPWHGPTGYDAPLVHPADGVIDALMLGLESGPRPVGFDLGDSPFGSLPVRNTVYVHGHPDFRLGQFADGWIYTRPISECQGVTPIRGWIHPGNLDEARGQEPDPRFRAASLRDFERLLARTAASPHRSRHLR